MNLQQQTFHQTLAMGALLDGGAYVIESLLGAGGFAKTYLAKDLSLARQVAIKEFFPRDSASREGSSVRPFGESNRLAFEEGRQRFEREARTLATVAHPNIVRVYRTFDENETSYIVLEFIDGEDLEDWLLALKRTPTQDELDALAMPLLDALESVHAVDILHRDISSRNIRIRAADGAPVLIDFGAARTVYSEGRKTTIAIKTPGYAPLEANASDARMLGPRTDIYGLAATFYRAMTGLPPQDAAERVLQDQVTSATKLGLTGYRPSFLAGIDWGLGVRPEHRPQTVAEWRAKLLDGRSTARPRRVTAAPTTQPPSAQTGRTGPVSTRPVSGRASAADTGPAAAAPTAALPASRKAEKRFPMAAVLGAALIAGGGASMAAWKMNLVDLGRLTGGTSGQERARIEAEAAAAAKREQEVAALQAQRERESREAADRERARSEQSARDEARAREAEAQRRRDDELRRQQEEEQRQAALQRQAEEARRREEAQRQAAAADARRREEDLRLQREAEQARLAAELRSWHVLAPAATGKPISALAAAPGGTRFATAAEDGVRLWQAQPAAVRAAGGEPLGAPRPPFARIALDADTQARVAVVGAKGAVGIYNTATGNRIEELAAEGAGRTVLAMSFTTGGQLAVLSQLVDRGGSERTYKWAVERSGPRNAGAGPAAIWSTGSGMVTAAAFTTSGDRVAIATRADRAGASSGYALYVLRNDPAGLAAPPDTAAGFPLTGYAARAAVSGNGGRAAVAYQDGRVEVWDVAERKVLARMTLPGRPLATEATAVALSEDGGLIAAAFIDRSEERGGIMVWDAVTGGERRRDALKAIPVRALVFVQGSGDPMLIAPWDDGSVRRIAIAPRS